MAINLKTATGMILDGCAASQCVDKSAESLDIAGVDISTLATEGTINYEHIQPDDKDADKDKKPAPGEETVGKIVFAKKIFSLADCDTDREEFYWKQVESPYIYIIYRLFDGAGHRGAQALAAAIRDLHANHEKILVRLSIEGSTLDRDPDNKNRITSSVARRVSATWRPCNETCDVGILADPNAPAGFDKAPVTSSDSLLSELVDKSEHRHPLYMPLGGTVETELVPFGKTELSTIKKIKMLAKARLVKALVAGNTDCAPSALVGGAALQREDRGLKAKAKKVLEKYNKPFVKTEFRAFVKSYLPDADDEYLDHFADAAEDLHLKIKKSEPIWAGLREAQAAIIELRKAVSDTTDESQVVEFQGRKVLPGHADTAHGPYALLGATSDHYLAVPKSKMPTWDHRHLVKLPRAQENTHFKVVQPPAVLATDLI